jgi:hypothetical protein
LEAHDSHPNAGSCFDATPVSIPKSSRRQKIYFPLHRPVIKFDGFMKVYLEGTDDEEAEEEGLLPELKGRQTKSCKNFPKQHFTQPPPRFTDASDQSFGRTGNWRPSLMRRPFRLSRNAIMCKKSIKNSRPPKWDLSSTIF